MPLNTGSTVLLYSATAILACELGPPVLQHVGFVWCEHLVVLCKMMLKYFEWIPQDYLTFLSFLAQRWSPVHLTCWSRLSSSAVMMEVTRDTRKRSPFVDTVFDSKKTCAWVVNQYQNNTFNKTWFWYDLFNPASVIWDKHPFLDSLNITFWKFREPGRRVSEWLLFLPLQRFVMRSFVAITPQTASAWFLNRCMVVATGSPLAVFFFFISIHV